MSLGAQYTYDDNWVGSINYVILELQSAVEYVSAQDMLNVDFNTGGQTTGDQKCNWFSC